MESHFMATKLNHSITRLMIKTKRQREAQASESSEDSSVRAASWQLQGGGAGGECSEGQAHSQSARGIQRVPRTRAQRISKLAWIGQVDVFLIVRFLKHITKHDFAFIGC